jgi:hypothetical protein
MKRKVATAAVFVLVIAGMPLTAASAASDDGYTFSIATDGQFGFDMGRQDDADSSLQATFTVFLDGRWEIEGVLTNADPMTYTFAIGRSGVCSGNTELFDLTIPGEPATASFTWSGRPSLASGYDLIRMYQQGNACYSHWGASIPTQPIGAITAPAPNSTHSGSVSLAAEYQDDDFDEAQWTVGRETCTAGPDTVAGGGPGATGPAAGYSWNGRDFAATLDTTGWTPGSYCFVFDTEQTGAEDAAENDVRLERWFTVEAVPEPEPEPEPEPSEDESDGDGPKYEGEITRISGGGQIRETIQASDEQQSPSDHEVKKATQDAEKAADKAAALARKAERKAENAAQAAERAAEKAERAVAKAQKATDKHGESDKRAEKLRRSIEKAQHAAERAADKAEKAAAEAEQAQQDAETARRVAEEAAAEGGQTVDHPRQEKGYKISFGGSLSVGDGAPRCQWDVSLHNTSVDDLDGGRFHGGTCTTPEASDGGASFAVYGSWNGESGYTMVIWVSDDGDHADTIRFQLFLDPGQSIITPDDSQGAPIYDSDTDFTSDGAGRTVVDHGNVKIKAA